MKNLIIKKIIGLFLFIFGVLSSTYIALIPYDENWVFVLLLFTFLIGVLGGYMLIFNLKECDE